MSTALKLHAYSIIIDNELVSKNRFHRIWSKTDCKIWPRQSDIQETRLNKSMRKRIDCSWQCILYSTWTANPRARNPIIPTIFLSSTYLMKVILRLNKTKKLFVKCDDNWPSGTWVRHPLYSVWILRIFTDEIVSKNIRRINKLH